MKPILFLIVIISLFSCKKGNRITHDNSYFQKAKKFSDSNAIDSAYYYFNLAKIEFIKASDSLGAGKSLVNMAMIQTNRGDYLGGIESSLEGNKYLKRPNDRAYRIALAPNYNNIALASHRLKDYEKSSQNYFKALQYIDNDESRYLCYNNIGDLLISREMLDSAKYYLKKALPTKDTRTLSKVINNIGRANYLSSKSYNPLPEFYKALEIRKKDGDSEGQNSSYETLSTYYLDKDKNLSLGFAKKMLQTATNNKSSEDQLLALQRIITLDSENYLQNFQKFNVINDSLQKARNEDKRQFAFVRYDVEQKNALTQKLKADNEIEKIRRNVGIGSLTILLIGGFFWYRKRQKQLKQEKELEVKNTQLKISKKVHDVVANGLYHMMIDVQNNPEMDKTRILNDIEKMYEESRDISHENIVEEDFAMRFINMIMSYSSNQQKVLPVGYKESIWENISYNTQLELYYILREILVNMKKHSQAKLASVRFEKDNDNLKIRYTDNGVGINDSDLHKGTGIRNTENRIESIGGDIIFEKNPKGGLIIQITIPIQSKYV